MKRLSFTHVGGDNLVIDVKNAEEIKDAVTRQDPCFALILEDDSILNLNTRNIVAWTAEDIPESESDTNEPEDTRTVAELKEALDKAGVEYDSKALKADLLELAKQNNV